MVISPDKVAMTGCADETVPSQHRVWSASTTVGRIEKDPVVAALDGLDAVEFVTIRSWNK